MSNIHPNINKNNKIQKDGAKDSAKKNLQQSLKEAIAQDDQEKINIIKNLENEIEKYFVINEVYKDSDLSVVFAQDLNNAMQEGSFNIVQMIINKEIELLVSGDFEAIAMLDKIKKNAQDKIKELNNIAIQNHQRQLNNSQDLSIEPAIEKVKKVAPKVQYKTIIPLDGFHIEKTLGGQYIQTLDADIKNLVGTDIINSKPEDLSQNIIEQIKNIRSGDKTAGNSNSDSILKDKNRSEANNEGYWVNQVTQGGVGIKNDKERQ